MLERNLKQRIKSADLQYSVEEAGVAEVAEASHRRAAGSDFLAILLHTLLAFFWLLFLFLLFSGLVFLHGVT